MLLAVTSPLLVSVTRDGIRMLFPVLLPILWVAAAPFARAVLAHLSVFFIAGQLLPPVFNPSLLLASFFAAYSLQWLILRWLEDLLAVAATPFIHTGRYRTSQLSQDQSATDLESAVKYLPRPRQCLDELNYITTKIAVVLNHH